MKAIAAINNLGYIGKDGKMMWKSSEDFKHFKEKTSGHILIMGATTFEKDLNGRMLPNRTTLIVSSREKVCDVKTYSLSDAVKEAIILQNTRNLLNQTTALSFEERYIPTEIWIVGGETIYKQLLPLIDEFHLSIINDNQIGDKKLNLGKLGYKGKLFKYNFEKNKD